MMGQVLSIQKVFLNLLALYSNCKTNGIHGVYRIRKGSAKRVCLTFVFKASMTFLSISHGCPCFRILFKRSSAKCIILLNPQQAKKCCRFFFLSVTLQFRNYNGQFQEIP
jgi:hypothetical protein